MAHIYLFTVLFAVHCTVCICTILFFLCCRQRKLEEALLFSGQFQEAMQALLDWLYKVEPKLGDEEPVHGDLDTVTNLMESHKVRITHMARIPSM